MVDGKVTNRISWATLMGYKQTWAFAIGKFMTDGVWWFFLFWLPGYLKDQYSMEGTAIIIPLTVLYSMTMVGSIGGGYFPTYFINKGMKPYDGRMKAMLMIAFIPLVVLAVQPLGYLSYWVPVIFIGIGASAHQAWSANIYTTVSDMFPKRSIATVVGIGGMAGGLGGVVVSKRREPPVRSTGGRRAPVDGSLYADHTSVSSSISAAGRRAASVSCFIKRGISPVAGSVQCGSCSVSLPPNESAGPLSSSLPNRTTPNSSPKSIVGSFVLSLP